MRGYPKLKKKWLKKDPSLLESKPMTRVIRSGPCNKQVKTNQEA
jgi:hypothetical protein